MLRVENNTTDYCRRKLQDEQRMILNAASSVGAMISNGTVSGSTLQNVPNISCSRFLCQCLLKGGDKTFLIDNRNDKRLTFNETFKMVKRASSWFGRRINKGDVICIYSGNRPHYITAFLAITAAGGALCHVNSEFTLDELEHLVESVGNVVSIIAEKGNVHNAIAVAEKNSNKIKVLMYTDDMDPIPEPTVSSFESILDGWTEEDLFLEDTFADSSTLIGGDPKQTVLHILSSSGTTGLPKRVLVSHSARLHNIFQLSDPNFKMCHSKREDSEILALLMPMHLMFPTVLWTHALAEGATIVTIAKFKPSIFLNALQEYGCTLLPVVPPLALFLIESPLTDKFDLSKLKKIICGGAPFPASIGEILQRKLKLESCKQGYGMTEMGHVMNLVNNKSNLRTLGSLLPGTELQVRDLQSNTILGPNQVGEFWIRGPQAMIGYQEFPSIFDEYGWLRSGDAGYYDELGEFYFVERLKDIIKVKGHQVAPAELESVILKHPLVHDCAVVGAPDPRAGELPLAFVVLKEKLEPHQVDGVKQNTKEDMAKDIQAFVASRTCRVKHLTGGVRFVDEIPRTPSGKVLRIILRRLLQSEKEK